MTQQPIKSTLKNHVYHWFKSLDIVKRMAIADEYIEDTSDNTDITQGFTDESEEWLVMNYTDDIKDFAIIELIDLCHMAYDELIAIRDESEDSNGDTIQSLIERIGLKITAE